jgi:hypothetical protein
MGNDGVLTITSINDTVVVDAICAASPSDYVVTITTINNIVVDDAGSPEFMV